MYNLPYFKENDPQVVMQFIHEHPFATISGCDENNMPVATQVPVFIFEKEGKQFLTGHMMKQTDHHRAFEKNPSVLALFSSQHCYVSASWYTNPMQGSTWNYITVHVKGKMRFLDQQALIEVLRKTTLHFEAGNSASPTVFDNLPKEYTTSMMKAIVAFEIEVESIDNVFKLSQNRDEESYRIIMDKLRQDGSGGAYIASEMEKRVELLFGKKKPPLS